MKLSVIMALVLVMTSSVFAAEVKDYIDGPTGVTVKLNEDGTIKSLVAYGESRLISGDIIDERSATKKATLRAKANISDFMTKSLSSKEVIDDLSGIASKITVHGKTPAQSSNTRQTLETQREIIRHNFDTILKGLVILTAETNKDKRYVKVVLGTNDKLMSAAVVSAAATVSGPAVAAPAVVMKKERAKPVHKHPKHHSAGKHRKIKKTVGKVAPKTAPEAAPAPPAGR